MYNARINNVVVLAKAPQHSAYQLGPLYLSEMKTRRRNRDRENENKTKYL